MNTKSSFLNRASSKPAKVQAVAIPPLGKKLTLTDRVVYLNDTRSAWTSYAEAGMWDLKTTVAIYNRTFSEMGAFLTQDPSGSWMIVSFK